MDNDDDDLAAAYSVSSYSAHAKYGVLERSGDVVVPVILSVFSSTPASGCVSKLIALSFSYWLYVPSIC